MPIKNPKVTEELQDLEKAKIVTKRGRVYGPRLSSSKTGSKKPLTPNGPDELYANQPPPIGKEPSATEKSPEAPEVEGEFAKICTQLGMKQSKDETSLLKQAKGIFERARNDKNSDEQVNLSDDELQLFVAYCAALNADNRSNAMPTIDFFYPDQSDFAYDPRDKDLEGVYPDEPKEELYNQSPHAQDPTHETVFGFPTNVWQPEALSGELEEDRSRLKEAESAQRERQRMAQEDDRIPNSVSNPHVDYGDVYENKDQLPIESNPNNLVENIFNNLVKNIFNAHKALNDFSRSYVKETAPEKKTKIKQSILATLTSLSQLHRRVDNLEAADQQKIYERVRNFNQQYEKNVKKLSEELQKQKSCGQPSAARDEKRISSVFGFASEKNPLHPQKK